METGVFTKCGAAVAVVVIAILVLTNIGSVYAFSSSVNANGSLNCDYLTINVYDGTGSTDASDEVVFTIPSTVVSNNVISSSADATLSENYCIRVSSNLTTSAFVYGYFKCTTMGGIAVESIEFQLSDGDSTMSAMLYKDAYKHGLTDSTAGTDTATALPASGDIYCREYVIQKVTIHYYAGIICESNNTVSVVSVNGDTSTNDTPSTGLVTSLDGFQFVFLASRTSLINE